MLKKNLTGLIRSVSLVLCCLMLLGVSSTQSSAQVVTLIDPTGDGGFENGNTFAANGWTLAAGVATNQWFVGNAATPFAGSNCAYISQTGNGSSYTYNLTSASTVYFYRDITFPAGKSRISLTINWQVGGENFFDRGMVCYTDPTNTPVVNDFISSTPPSYATSVTGNFNTWATTTGGNWTAATTYLLPGSFAGTTKRIIFGWQNDNGGTGLNPPIAFDNISLTASPGITCTPTVNGGLWSDAASWTGGLYPGAGDDVLIPDGTSITLDASQTVKSVTVGQGTSGTLNFTTAFNALTVTGDVTVNNGGRFNGFTQSQSPTAGGITLSVAGNLNLNAGGIMTLSHSGALLNMNGTSPQSINGPGVFLDGIVRVFQIANPTSVTLNVPIKASEAFRHYAGTLNTNGNLILDNTAQSYGNVFNQQVYTVVVNGMGTGYTSQPTVTIAAPTGAGTQATAVANWDAVSQKVRSITITNPGSGYRANPIVTFSGATFTTAATATAVVLQSIQGNASFSTIKNGGTTVNGGIITINNGQGLGGMSVTNTTANNIGYVTAPTVGFGLPVRTFQCPTQGSGYTSATVTTTYPSGTVTTPAGITALVVNGKVTSITVVSGGTYVGGNGIVNVVIAGTNTTPATGPTLNIPVANAIITNGMISGFNVTNAGSDYITAPTATLTGGSPSAAAAAPSCRIGLYNLQYSITSAPTGVIAPVGYTIANAAAVEGPEMPANRKLNTLTVNNGAQGLTLSGNLELTAATSAISTSSGIINFSGINKTITCSNPAYAGTTSATSATAPSFVNGIVMLTTPGGTATRSFPVGRGIQIVTGTGSGAFGVSGGSDITSITAQTDVAPTGSFTTGTFSLTGIRTYNVVKNGSQFGTSPTATVFWGVEDNLASDNATLHVAQATATSGSWTVKSVAGAAGLLGPSGSKATATATPGPIVYNANDYFTFATSFTPPPALSYQITRTTSNNYNSIAATGSSIPSWSGTTSTETQRSNAVSLAGTTFQYQGSTVAGFIVGIDGYFTFNTAFTSNISTVQLGPSSFPITSALAPFWGNLGCNPNDFTAASRDASIKYKIDGTLGSGSAIITIEWIHMTGSQNPVQNTGSDLNFQIKLYENGNKIEFNYGLMQGFDGSSQTVWSYACGLNGSYMQSFTAPGQLLALQEHDENTTNFSYEKAQVANAGTNILHTLPACYSSYIFTPGVQAPYVPGSIIPVNDEPAGAVVLTELASPPTDYCGATYSSYGATATALPVCTGNAAGDVWFKFTATDPSTAVKVVSSGGYDAVIQVLDASLNPLSPVMCKDTSNDGRVEIAKISGLTVSGIYYVRVYHKLGGTQATAVATVSNGNISTVTITNPGSGYALPSAGSTGTPRVRVSGGGGNNGVLLAQTSGTNAAPGGITGMTISSVGTGYTSAPTITIDPPLAGVSGDFAITVYSNSPPPANDVLCGAVPLTVGLATCSPVSGTTFGATASGGIPICTGTADDDVFYSFVAPAVPTPVTIQVQGSAGFDAVVQVLASNTNDCNGILSSVLCSNATSTGAIETVTIPAGLLINGSTNFIRVYHASSGAGSGSFSICIFESGPPCPFSTSPSGSLAYVGGTTLSWNASSGATGYDVYFSTVQADVVSGAPTALVSSNQVALTYLTGALTNGTTYYWRVDARNAIGASVGCNVRAFTATTDLIMGSNATICSGNFYDSGGPSGLYQNNENSVTTICPSTAGTSSSVTFTSFNTSLLLGDMLSIYNGSSIASPQFAGSPFGGFPGPSGNTYTSTDNSGCLTFKFTSDGDNNNGPGWSATINCVITCAAAPVSPLNGANVCQSTNTILSWPSNAGATGYDVYLDITNPPTTLVSSNQAGTSYNAGNLAVGNYYWKIVTKAGAITCNSPSIWNFSSQADPDPTHSSNSPVCEGNAVVLLSDNITPGQTSGNSYSWSTNAAAAFTSTQQNPSVTGSATVNNSGDYTVVITNIYGCTATAVESVIVNPNPVLNIASFQNVGCIGGSDGVITVNATGSQAPYDFTSDFITFNQTGVITNLSTGNTTVYVSDGNGCNAQISQALTYTSTVPTTASVVVPFTGMPTNVCAGTTASLSISAVPNATMYIWDAPAGSYFNGNVLNVSPFTTSTPSVSVTYGSPSGSLYTTGVQAANGCGASLRKVQKTRGLTSVPASVSGSSTACAGSTGTYTTAVIPEASSYLWTITGNATVSGTGTTATVTFGAGWTGGTLCVSSQTSCYTSPSKCIAISNTASTLGAISGSFTACPNTTLNYTVPASTGAASYTWTLPAGSSGSSGTNSINVAYGAGYSAVGSICVSVTSVCGITSAPKCKTVAPGLPTVPSSITGSLSGLCNQTKVYSCPSQGAGVTYNWTSPGSITSGQGTTSISTSFGAFSTSNVCVTATNSCGTSTSRCVPVKGAPNAPGAITATPSSWCANTSGIEFDVNVGALTGSYALNWSYPVSPVATYVLGGGNSTSLIMDWGTGSGNINVTASNACGSGTKTSTWSSSCREGAVATVSSITVSPNPTTGVINVNYTTTKGTTQLMVSDLAGRVVMTQNTASVEGSNNTQLDMSKLARGAYMISVQSTQGSKQVRVVVE